MWLRHPALTRREALQPLSGGLWSHLCSSVGLEPTLHSSDVAAESVAMLELVLSSCSLSCVEPGEA